MTLLMLSRLPPTIVALSDRNFWIDLWLRIRYGEWTVGRKRAFSMRPSGKVEWYWEYRAQCQRTNEHIYCESKRIAEGVCATNNDVRGTAPTVLDIKRP